MKVAQSIDFHAGLAFDTGVGGRFVPGWCNCAGDRTLPLTPQHLDKQTARSHKMPIQTDCDIHVQPGQETVRSLYLQQWTRSTPFGAGYSGLASLPANPEQSRLHLAEGFRDWSSARLGPQWLFRFKALPKSSERKSPAFSRAFLCKAKAYCAAVPSGVTATRLAAVTLSAPFPAWTFKEG